MRRAITGAGAILGGILGTVLEPGKILEIATAAIIGGLCGEGVKSVVVWLKQKCGNKEQGS